MPELHFRIPDRVFVGFSVVVIVLTWAMILWLYPDLPTRVPSHFGPSGQPDAYGEKSFWLVAFPALLQTALSILWWWLYRHPQYSNIPSTVLISLMPEPIKSILFKLIRHMLVVMAVLINLLFAQISLATISVALGVTSGLNSWIVGGLVAAILGISIFYAVWMYRIAKVGRSQLSSQSTPSNHQTLA